MSISVWVALLSGRTARILAEPETWPELGRVGSIRTVGQDRAKFLQ